MQNSVLHILKHVLDVFCINCRCEVVKQRLAAFSPAGVEHVEQEGLDICYGVRVTLKLGNIFLNAYMFNLLSEEVHFVEKENNRHIAEGLVVDDCLEYVTGLDEAIGLAILHKDLVKLTRRRQEQDGGYALETLKPFLALRPLPSHINEHKGDALNQNLVFVDTFGGLTSMQDVQLDWNVALKTHKHKLHDVTRTLCTG